MLLNISSGNTECGPTDRTGGIPHSQVRISDQQCWRVETSICVWITVFFQIQKYYKSECFPSKLSASYKHIIIGIFPQMTSIDILVASHRRRRIRVLVVSAWRACSFCRIWCHKNTFSIITEPLLVQKCCKFKQKMIAMRLDCVFILNVIT